jgi:nitroreductase
MHCGHCGSFCPARAILDTSAEAKRLTKKDLAFLHSPESLQLLFRSRRSVRRYKDKPVSRTDIGRILEACRYTPTGVNNQAIHYIVIDSPAKIAELRQITLPAVIRLFGMAERIAAVPFLGPRILGEQFVRDLKTHFLPSMRMAFDRTKRGNDKLFYHAPAILLVHGEKIDDMAFSCAVALFNGSLLAHTLGIGCCFNGFLSLAANYDKQVKRWLGIPKNHKCHGAMTFGYQAVKYNALVRRDPPKVRWLG